ncbi:MAG: glycosyltransferase family 4 protein [Pseudomonadota bacterium]|jgi:glycosyltransferase involved in cell wall biosynthesis
MIRVGFDTSALDPRFKSHAQRGIGRYVSHLADFLRQQSSADIEFDWFDHNNLIHQGVATKVIDLLPCARTTIRQQLLYPLKLRSGNLKRSSFVHFPAHMDGPAWSPKPYILTVHDLIPLILEKLYRQHRPNWRYQFARWLENTSIRNAAMLIAVSETTANDVVRLLGVPRERIAVTPNGVEQGFFDLYPLRRQLSSEARTALRARLGIPLDRPILFYVGGHDERKNIPMVVEIARGAIAECSERAMPQPVLVLAGKINSERERETLNTALRDFAMAADTIDLGFVTEADLRALYAESAVFLFPSLYEGFGLPVLEAMAAGVPVVSSNRGALPEVMGRVGISFDPEDPIAGCKGVLEILSNKGCAESISEQGHHRAREFTWERTGRLTLDAYRQAAALLGVSHLSNDGRDAHENGIKSGPLPSVGNAEV